MDYSIFHLHRRIDNPGDPLIINFSIFPGRKFAQLGTFSGEETEICFQVSFFSRDLFKIKFQGIYESNNHLF